MYTPRQDLIERVQVLPESSQRHVFHMLRTKGIKYTENNNGVFFNLTQCQDAEVWSDLQRIVDQETTMQRENTEREKQIREMQEVLRKGIVQPPAPTTTTTASSEVPASVAKMEELPKKRGTVASRVAKASPIPPTSIPIPPTQTPNGGRGAKSGGVSRDILSMLAK